MILIVNKSKKNARDFADMFHFMGILAYAVTPHEALSEISTEYRAVLIMNPDLLADKQDFTTRLRSYADIPIFAITKAPDEIDEIIFDSTIRSAAYAAVAYRCICDYTESHGLRSPGSYKLAGINASVNLYAPIFFNKGLPFTKTETMILRALIRSYPLPISAKNILKYAFRQSRLPDISSVRTHISIMNKKYRKITSRNIVTLIPGEGYVVLTPEMLEKRNSASEALLKTGI